VRKSALMTLKEVPSENVAGQASFEMANLRPARTGLPFVVFIPNVAGDGVTSA
jgi:hypothetical protein